MYIYVHCISNLLLGTLLNQQTKLISTNQTFWNTCILKEDMNFSKLLTWFYTYWIINTSTNTTHKLPM